MYSVSSMHLYGVELSSPDSCFCANVLLMAAVTMYIGTRTKLVYRSQAVSTD